MRAIIIDDKDCKSLLEKLELQKTPDRNRTFNEINLGEEWMKLPESTRDAIIQRIHARFHYVVCLWLQDQGGEVS